MIAKNEKEYGGNGFAVAEREEEAKKQYYECIYEDGIAATQPRKKSSFFSMFKLCCFFLLKFS